MPTDTQTIFSISTAAVDATCALFRKCHWDDLIPPTPQHKPMFCTNSSAAAVLGEYRAVIGPLWTYIYRVHWKTIEWGVSIRTANIAELYQTLKAIYRGTAEKVKS